MSKYKYLVLSGAGAAGIAYAGALSELYYEPAFSPEELKGVAGASAGAIAGLLVALRYTADEARQKLVNLDYAKIAKERLPKELYNLLKDYGRFTGEEIYRFILDVIKEKMPTMDPAKVTFADLSNAGFIDFHVVVTKMYEIDGLAKGKKKIFSVDTTPHTSVAAAVRASAAAPFYFTGVRMKKIAKGHYVLSEDGDWYSDGGMIDNFPIRIFDKPQYLENNVIQQANVTVVNPSTLGIAVLTTAQIADRTHKGVKNRIANNRPLLAAKAIANTLLCNLHLDNLQDSDWERTIKIDRLNVGVGDFNMTNEKKLSLVRSGQIAVKSFFHPDLTLGEAARIIRPCNDKIFYGNKQVVSNGIWSPANHQVRRRDDSDQSNDRRRCVIM